MSDIPYGYCQCGCGQKTTLSPRKYLYRNVNKGEPFHFIAGHQGRIPFMSRFWDKVDVRGENECWEWQRERFSNGYGIFHKDGRRIGAHRIAFELATGTLDPALEVLHTCDNPPCCNPNHLWQGTQSDNMDDKVRKGRQFKGKRRPK